VLCSSVVPLVLLWDVAGRSRQPPLAAFGKVVQSWEIVGQEGFVAPRYWVKVVLVEHVTLPWCEQALKEDKIALLKLWNQRERRPVYRG
jgi:hypothetical protein